MARNKSINSAITVKIIEATPEVRMKRKERSFENQEPIANYPKPSSYATPSDSKRRKLNKVHLDANYVDENYAFLRFKEVFDTTHTVSLT
jgi:hypothetical protein